MFQALAQFISSCSNTMAVFLMVKHAIYNWTYLGLFTGSCVSEDSQTRLKAGGVHYNTIPNRTNAGIWAGQPLAFVCTDFTFYTTSHQIVPLLDIVSSHGQKQLVSVHIRFCFEKSLNKVQRPFFCWAEDIILDPVAAAIRCIHCANLLGFPIWEPIGVYKSPHKGPCFLRDYNVLRIMQQACIWAYPNPLHYMRVNISSVVPHWNQITAAVALKPGGASNEEIAFHLRWHVSGIPTYLQEYFKQVGALIQTTLTGAYRTPL
jgi:hypothetical protein